MISDRGESTAALAPANLISSSTLSEKTLGHKAVLDCSLFIQDYIRSPRASENSPWPEPGLCKWLLQHQACRKRNPSVASKLLAVCSVQELDLDAQVLDVQIEDSVC